MGIRQLDGQTAWIGGGASGMGAAASELLAREGANVAVVDVQVERGQELAERIRARGDRAVFLRCDVGREGGDAPRSDCLLCGWA